MAEGVRCFYCDKIKKSVCADEQTCRDVCGFDPVAKAYPDCKGEGWFKSEDDTLVVCYGNKCH